MTADELHRLLNDLYGRTKPWPKYREVDAETYANVCQEIFDNLIKTYPRADNHVYIALGPLTNGIMFKNVELILVKK